MSYQISTLDNGLRVASERMPNTHSAAFAIAVDVGARHEELAEGGLSHLLEHMAFKGTSKLNARRIAEAFDLMGGNVNAYTSHEHTVYYAKVLKEYGPQALKLLCEIVADSIFDPVELERERDVVLQEIAMHQDSPDDVVFDLFQESVFDTQPLGRSILGPQEQVAAYSRDDLIDYTHKHYLPARMVISAAGAVQHKTVRTIAEQFFGARAQANRVLMPAPATFHTGRRTLEKDLEQVQLVLGYPGLPNTHEDYYALQVFSTILGGGMSSRLFQEIREERGLAYSVYSFASGYSDAGLVGLYAGCSPARAAEVAGLMLDGLRAIAHDGITDAELVRARGQLGGASALALEDSDTRMSRLGRSELTLGEFVDLDESLRRLAAVSTDDVRELARDLAHGPLSIAAVGPVDDDTFRGLDVESAAA